MTTLTEIIPEITHYNNQVNTMKKILVCTDGSDYSDVCCHYAIWLARLLDAQVDVVHVTEFAQMLEPTLALNIGGGLGMAPIEELYDQIQRLESQKSEKTKVDVIKLFEENNLLDRTTYYQKTGDLVEILDTFETGDNGCDIVLLGKRGEHANLAKGHLGSSLERIVRSSKKPCLVTPRSFREIKKIALACDGGPSVQKAIDFLKRTPALKAFDLTVMSVDESLPIGKAQQNLVDAQIPLAAAGYNPSTKLIQGPVEEMITAAVEEDKIDLLIMGAYGHSRIRELLIGSTTTVLLHSCKIPLMLFR